MRQPSTSSTSASPWPPPEYALPSSIEGIEAGRPPRQRALFPDVPDDSQAARLARLSALPGVTTGDRLTPKGVGRVNRAKPGFLTGVPLRGKNGGTG
jgi:hypothetical protein